MLHYIYVLDEARLQRDIVPALAACWRLRSFQPLPALAAALAAALEPSSLLAAAPTLPFDRRLWQAVVGETLVLAALEMPVLPLDADALLALARPDRLFQEWSERESLSPLEQVFWGSRDLRIGPARYRPLSAGLNAGADLPRLTRFLESINVSAWTVEALRSLPHLTSPADREEELALARAWWGETLDLYRRAERDGLAIVCEVP